jgi:anti-sigma B factor antagonist
LSIRELLEMPDTADELNVSRDGSVTIVRFRDRKIIDELQIQRIGERLRALALAERSPKMMLDFSAVEYLSSRALSELINLSRQVDQRGGQLALAGIHPQIYEVFKITRLNRLFRIEASVEDAMKGLM